MTTPSPCTVPLRDSDPVSILCRPGGPCLHSALRERDGARRSARRCVNEEGTLRCAGPRSTSAPGAQADLPLMRSGARVYEVCDESRHRVATTLAGSQLAEPVNRL